MEEILHSCDKEIEKIAQIVHSCPDPRDLPKEVDAILQEREIVTKKSVIKALRKFAKEFPEYNEEIQSCINDYYSYALKINEESLEQALNRKD